MRLFLLLLLIPAISLARTCYKRSDGDGTVTLVHSVSGCYIKIWNDGNGRHVVQDAGYRPNGPGVINNSDCTDTYANTNCATRIPREWINTKKIQRSQRRSNIKGNSDRSDTCDDKRMESEAAGCPMYTSNTDLAAICRYLKCATDKLSHACLTFLNKNYLKGKRIDDNGNSDCAAVQKKVENKGENSVVGPTSLLSIILATGTMLIRFL